MTRKKATPRARQQPPRRTPIRMPEELEQLLKRRATELAARRSEGEHRKVVAEVVVVRRADFIFATPLTQTREVRQVRIALLPVPSDAITGLFQIRGRTDCLVDLAALLGQSDPLPHDAQTLALIVSGAQGDLGLRIDEVIGSREIYADEVADTATTFDWIAQITADRIHLIDIAGLLSCAEIQVGAAAPNSFT